jgi:hypothetical protein
LLEKASKPGDGYSPEICLKDTPPFFTDVRKFLDGLRGTSLLGSPSGKGEKPEGDPAFLKGQIALLKDACLKYSFGDTKKIIAALGEFDWGGETEKELEQISQFAVSFEYEKALEGIERLLK